MATVPISPPARATGDPLGSRIATERLRERQAAREAHRRKARLGVIGAVVTDTTLVLLTFVIAWWLRYVAQIILTVHEFNQVEFDEYVPFMYGFCALTLGALAFKGLYRRRFGSTWLDDVGAVISGTTLAAFIFVTAAFFSRPDYYSRLMFIYVWAIAILLLAGWRVGLRLYRRWEWSRGIGLRRAVIVGAGLQGRLIMQSMLAQSGLGYHVVGFLDSARQEDLGRFRWLGEPDDLPEVVAKLDVEEAIIALPSTAHDQILSLIDHCTSGHVEFRIVPDFFDLSLDRVSLNYIDGIPLIGVRERALRGANALLKRAIDVTVSGLLLLVTAPLTLLIALAIKLDDPAGPVLYRQRRVGRDGRPFEFYKFRTMRVSADAERAKLAPRAMDGARFKLRDDPRRTRVGRWLRRFSLDEIPQFVNVLRGDMSLVGPRPPLPDEAARYDEWSGWRLTVSPGLTGIWQVSGRSDLPFEDMVLLDRWYIENWSLALDLSILLRTVPAVLTGRGAY